MKEVLPFDLLHTIVDQIGSESSPIEVQGKKYRPIVFQVNDTRHYVFCLVPVAIEPREFFEEVGDAYELFLDGIATKYIFFRDKSSDGLISQVLEWYNTKAA